MSKAKEIINVFVEQEEQPHLPGIPGGRLEPLLGSYEFLKMVADPDELAAKGHSDLKDLGEGRKGEIWIIHEPEINIMIDSMYFAEQYMNKDEALTEEVQKAFDSEYEGGGWKDWRQEWVEKKGWKVGDYGSDNTYNWDSYNWWGDIFEYTHFITDENDEGIIIQWHGGGDARGNYSSPEIWMGSVEEFMGYQHMGDPEEEIAYTMGYEGNSDALKEDIEKWKEENYKGD